MSSLAKKPAGSVSSETVRPAAIQLAGREISYQLRLSSKARHLRLRVSQRDGLEVIVPAQSDLSDLNRLIESKQNWILGKLDQFQSAALSTEAELEDGSTVRYLGQEYRLSVIRTAGGVPRAELQRDRLVLTLPDGASGEIRDYLEAWYRLKARRVIPEQVADINQSFEFTYQRITIKSQRRRWGSCSDRGNLNFNWRLILAPISVIRYVVTHELAHLAELNHSPRFWALVESRCPEYKQAQEWLKLHGFELSI